MKSLISIIVLLAAPSLARACDACSAVLVQPVAGQTYRTTEPLPQSWVDRGWVQRFVDSSPRVFVQPRIVAPIIVPEIIVPQVVVQQFAIVEVRDTVRVSRRIRIVNRRRIAPLRAVARLVGPRRNVVRQRTVIRGW